MPKHVYMSSRAGTPDGNGGFKISEDMRMHYRGVAGNANDAENFKETMALQGYLVIILDRKPRKEVIRRDEKKRPREPQGPPWVFARDMM